ncbi:MAG: penicillin-insensitive murein endopeptidase [Enhygromyxa sp.]
MHGISIRINAPDGRTWTVPFQGVQLSVGRTSDNDIVLEQHGVSSHHCVIGRDPTGALLLQDRGSTNGTWIGGQKAEGVIPLQPGVGITVGSYLLTLETGAKPAGMTSAQPILSRPVGVRGPLIRRSEDETKRQRLLDRVQRYAEEWDKAGRPSRLLLRGRNLARALDLLEQVGDADELFDDLQESFVRASSEGRERGKVLRIASMVGGGLALVGAIALMATCDWGGDEQVAVAQETEGEDAGETGAGADDSGIEIVDSLDLPEAEEQKETFQHTVIPAETLEEIALRYDVPIQSISRWNGIDESTPLTPGQTLKITAAKRPLAQQMIVYRPDKKESWSSLAQRFDVPVAKLRAYNPEIEGDPKSGSELTVWIDPKPLVRKPNVKIPEFEVRPDAISVGAPKNGKLLNGIQFPADDKLYKRRKPYIMWCSSHMAKHLREAIAGFRYTYDFQGELVVADMSQKRGGKFPPHQSHQAGRDVDIWLPSLKGVYQKNHLQRDRRPNPEEADWFALYGFLKALHETGEVQAVFLAYELHDRVYQAAKLMGASDEELDEMIAYPRGAHYRKTLLQHSAGHTHHVHVRFKCGPNDQCSNVIDNDPGD